MERPLSCTIRRLCGGPENIVQLSADDLEQLLLPVLRIAGSEEAFTTAAHAMAMVKRQGGGPKAGGRGRAGLPTTTPGCRISRSTNLRLAVAQAGLTVQWWW